MRYLLVLLLLCGCAQAPMEAPKAGPDPSWLECPDVVVKPAYGSQIDVGGLILDYDEALGVCRAHMDSLRHYLMP